MTMKPLPFDKEAIARAVRLLEMYKGGDGKPSVTLSIASINKRPSLTFFYPADDASACRAEFFENELYTGINGYDDVYPGPFAMGVEKLEELVNEQS